MQNDLRPGSDRLSFLASHLDQLQALRWLGLHLLLLLSPAFVVLNVRHASMLATAISVFGVLWFLRFRKRIRNRFGRTELTPAQRLRLRFPSPFLAFIPAVFLLGHFYCRYMLKVHNDDFIIAWALVLWLEIPIADAENPPVRRSAYVLALAVLTLTYMQFAFWTPMDDWRGALAFSSLGGVLLSLAIFDYALLCRLAQGNSSHKWLHA